MDLIKRNIKKEITEHLSKKEITLITGSRQVGKTTLMNEIIKDLKRDNKKVSYFNLDIDSHADYFKTQETLISKIRLEIGDSGYVFIDEIQRLGNAGLFLKGMFDRSLDYKFVVTGSGSLELKEKIHESLAGRKRIFEMMPVNFIEFVNFRTTYKYEEKIDKYFEIEKEQTQLLLLEYLNFGGFPAVVKEPVLSEKIMLMDEIFRSYIEKDLVYLLRIEQPELFRLLIRIISIQSGKMVNYSELAKQTGLSLPTVRKYLWYAEKTFAIYPLTPWFTNILKEITKSGTCYFNDLGFRNYAIGSMGTLTANEQMGFAFQNFVFLILKELCRKQNYSLHFWRTTDKAEVDFVLARGNEVIPVEVKYGDMVKPTLSRSFRNFAEKYLPAEAWIINRTMDVKITIDKTTVTFIPFYNLFGKI